MNVIKYLYYRYVKFYQRAFKIGDSPGFLIHSCYSWGLLVLLTSLMFYLLSVENILFWIMGIALRKEYILVTTLPLGLLYLFSEHWMGDEKSLYNDLCKKYKNERFMWFKGVLSLAFAVFSLPCYLLSLSIGQ